MRPVSRVMIAIAAVAIAGLLIQPIWRIDLAAPQYPEGLALQIFHDRFTGDVNKINGLNHYIGMATIHNEMFPEFAIMRYAIVLLIGWGVVAAAIGRRGALFTWLMVLGAFVLWAMWDMFAWGYKYGHDLDPHAAIKVEGMAYQPPLFGHKKLLNFDAWSLPDIGGWILFAVISVAVLTWLIEWKWPWKPASSTTIKAADQPVGRVAPVLAVLVLSVFMSCTTSGPPMIDFGKVECASCRMNVVDQQFASALITAKGRTYVFDSPECMVQHVSDGSVAESEVASWWVCDHAHPGTLLDATQALYLASPDLHSPMNGNVAAFANEADRTNAENTFQGEALDWSGARKRLSTN